MKSFFLFCIYFICFLHSPGFTDYDSKRSCEIPYQGGQVGRTYGYTRAQLPLEAGNNPCYSGGFLSDNGSQNVLDPQRNQTHIGYPSSDRLQDPFYHGSVQQPNFSRGQCFEGDNSACLGIPVCNNQRGIDARGTAVNQQSYPMGFNNNTYPVQMNETFMKKILTFASSGENITPFIEKGDSVNKTKYSLKVTFNGQSSCTELKQIDFLFPSYSISFLNPEERLFTNFVKALFLIKQNSEGFFLFKLTPIFVYNPDLGSYNSDVVFWMENSTGRMWAVHNTVYNKGSISVNSVIPVYVNKESPFFYNVAGGLYFVDNYGDNLFFLDPFFNLINKNIVLVKDCLRQSHDFVNANMEKLWIKLWI